MWFIFPPLYLSHPVTAENDPPPFVHLTHILIRLKDSVIENFHRSRVNHSLPMSAPHHQAVFSFHLHNHTAHCGQMRVHLSLTPRHWTVSFFSWKEKVLKKFFPIPPYSPPLSPSTHIYSVLQCAKQVLGGVQG